MVTVELKIQIQVKSSAHLQLLTSGFRIAGLGVQTLQFARKAFQT